MEIYVVIAVWLTVMDWFSGVILSPLRLMCAEFMKESGETCLYVNEIEP